MAATGNYTEEVPPPTMKPNLYPKEKDKDQYHVHEIPDNKGIYVYYKLLNMELTKGKLRNFRTNCLTNIKKVLILFESNKVPLSSNKSIGVCYHLC